MPRWKRIWRLFVGVLPVAYAGATFASDLVVVRTEGPSGFKIGTVLDSDTPIQIPSYASVTVVDGAGRKIVVSGPRSGALGPALAGSASKDTPGSAPATGAPLDVVGSLARLFTAVGPHIPFLGTTRGIGAGPLNDPWAIDTSQSGDHCFDATKPTALWRPLATGKAILTVRNRDTRERAEAAWPAGAASLAWPGEVPLVDGASYELGTGGTASGAQITLHRVPRELPTRIHQAAWMADHKCDRQAMLLVVAADVDKFVDALAKEGKF